MRRIVAAAIAAALGTVGVYWMKMRNRPGPSLVSEKLPAGVNQQLSGYTFTRSVGGRQIFTVHAAKTLAYKDGGTTVLEDVSVEVFGREGNRHDLLRTESCDYNQRSGELSCAGRVEIELDAPPGAGTVAPALPPAEPSPKSAPHSGILRVRAPAYIETSNVSYQPQGALLVTDRPVQWRFGPASGSALGFAYATKDGRVELKSNVIANLPPVGESPRIRSGMKREAAAANLLRLTAGGLRYTKGTGEVDLRGPVEITEGARRVTSAGAMIALDAKNQVRSAVLTGDVRAWDSDGAKSLEASAASVRADFDPDRRELRKITAEGPVEAYSRRAGSQAGVSHLTAQEVTLNFSGPHFNPTDGVAKGAVEFSAEPSAKSSAKSSAELSDPPGARSRGLRRETLTATEVDFKFRPQTSTLEQAATVGTGKLALLPADSREGERTVTAGRFLMVFDAQSRLQLVQGFSPTQMTVEPSKSDPTRPAMVASGDQLHATLDPSSGALVTVIQSGKFHFQGGERQATADEAQYSAERRTLTLTGRPLLWEPDGRVRADRVRLDLAADVAEGLGHVQSAHLEKGADFNAPGGSDAGTRSRSGKEAEGVNGVTNVLADQVVVNRRTEVARYTGQVRAWRGYEVIQSPSLDIYRKERRIVAESGVVTSDLQPASLPLKPSTARARNSAGTKTAGATRPVTIKADRLEYFDSKRRASYEGHVRLDSEDATLQADRLDAFFSGVPGESEARIERVTADGHVVVTEPRRRATGEHAEYLAALGKIIMTGGPPTLYDADTGFATGERLTFSIHDDTLIVDGGAKSPAVSQHQIVP